MNKKIVYTEEDGTVCIIHPNPFLIDSGEYTIEQIAEKDVSPNRPYKIVDIDTDTTFIPEDRTFRNAWEISNDELTDGTGAETNMFITDPHHPDYVEPEGVE